MLVTEEQARKKWCGESAHTDARCLATDCMHWRWWEGGKQHWSTCSIKEDMPPPEVPSEQGEGWVRVGDVTPMPSLFGSTYWGQQWARPTPNRRGFCGKSGVPEHE